MTIRTAMIGFGMSGKVFHTPFLADNPAYSLDLIVTGNPERAAQAAGLHPGARIVATPEELFADPADLDLVVVGTPPSTHGTLADAALDAGLHVVVDKPFVPSVADGEALLAKARAVGRVLTVFQNRRWDSDFLTVRRLIADGELGEVITFESRFDAWKPAGLRSWKGAATLAEGGGLLADLGPHLIDQALQLFGPAVAVYGETARHSEPRDAEADDDAFVSLLHASGVRSHLSMNIVTGLPAPRFRVLGTAATFESWGMDPQERQLDAGMAPSDPRYGIRTAEHWGTLGTPEAAHHVRPERGAYQEFYRLLAETLTAGGPLPVDPLDALAAMRIIEQVHAQNR
ncbi:MAG: Gfo/Idh/MocA family protein [Actinomycetota bacterium]